MFPRLALPLVALAAFGAALPAGHGAPAEAVAVPAAERTRWLTDGRFGLFIHWGPYSALGDEYRGKQYKRAEQIQEEARIPNADYDVVAKAFNPVKFDAKAWARAAKDAGMKYLVITSKHHDGFAMFKSSNPFNIVDFSDFKRDPLAELAAACREEGVKFCVYYSLGRDWREPDVPAYRQNTWDFPGKKNNDIGAYIDRKVKPQVTELLKQYDPAAIWFDTPEHTDAKQSDELMTLIRSVRPDCLVNARVGNGRGDYAITEQTVPAGKVKGKPFESCITMNRHWGYDKFDGDWKSADMMLRVLVDVASKGGNLLLNVGPTGEGEIPAPSLERLAAMGAWLRVNGESVYGTGHTVFGYEYAGTAKSAGAGVDAMGQEIKGAAMPTLGHGVSEPEGWRCTATPGAIYIHLMDWPKEGPVLKKFPGKVAKATFLADGAPVAYAETGDTVTLKLPKRAPRPGIVVVKLELTK